MKLNEALEKVWKAVDKIERIDFNQTGEEIKEDLLGIHRKFRNQDGVMDEVTNCLQELQEVIDEYKEIEDELKVEFLTIQKLRKTDHIYVNRSGHIRELSYYHICMDDECVYINGDLYIEEKDYVEEDYIFEVKDKEYGTTWAFTKKELED